MKLKYFTLDEFDSPDKPGSGAKMMDPVFLQKLDSARDIAGIPFIVESGFRTFSHNNKVGGKADSSHLIGCAADLRANGSRERFLIIQALIRVGFNRIGVNMAGTLIHVDDDERKDKNVMWMY